MIKLLIICVLARNVISKSFNVQEALKLFESLQAANSPSKLQGSFTKEPNSSDLLAVLHEAKPVLSGEVVYGASNAKPLLESRENYGNNKGQDSEALRSWLKGGSAGSEGEQDSQREITTESTKTTKQTDRRLFEWFQNLIGKSKSSRSKSTTKSYNVTTEKNAFHFERNDFETFREVLNKLNDVLQNLNKNVASQLLAENQTQAVLLIKVPFKNNFTQRVDQNFRFKRDVANLESNATVDEEIKSSNKTDANEERTKEIDETEVHNAKVNETLSKNNSNEDNVEDKDDNATFSSESSTVPQTARRRKRRRYYKRFNRRNNDEFSESDTESVKSKLISHISENFKELKNKISPLEKIKELYLDDDAFKVGYITANIDTLEVNLDKLKKEMEAKKNEWDENKVLDLFERINTSNRLVGNLMEALKGLVEKRSLPSGVRLYQ